MPPRASKRKIREPPTKSVPAAAPKGSSDKPKTTNKRRATLFVKYANSLLGMIDPEGIEALCADIKVDVTDVKILMLAWKMKAQKQGYFTREEWETGLKALHVDTLDKLKKSFYMLEIEVRRPENFDDFFSFAFRYCLTEERQKVVDIETICVLLNLVLRSQFSSIVDSLTEYLKIQKECKAINMDQWMSFLRFCKEIDFPEMGNYDPEQSWPLVLDYFVEWMREKNGFQHMKECSWLT